MFNGQNVGTPALTRYILDSPPKLVLSGHIHEAGPLGNNPKGVKGVAMAYNPYNNCRTSIVNPGNLGRFELLDFPSLETRMKFDYGTFARVEVEDDGTLRKVVQYSLTAPGRKIGKVEKLDEICFD